MVQCMNKNIIILVMLIVFGQSITAQTYYYRYTKSIINNVENTNVSGGQFITFDGKKCFESDKYGNNVGNGSMAYDAEVSRNTRLETYWGSCYWSKNAHMKFNADKSLMNIETNVGKIYVYKRVVAPANVTTCSLIREPEPSSGGGGGGGYISPDYPVQPNYPQGGYGSGGTTTDPGGGTKPIKPERDKREKVRRTCAACNGKGTYEKNGDAVTFGSSTRYKIRCNTCGYEYWNTQTHSHPACPTCHGKGYVEYWL